MPCVINGVSKFFPYSADLIPCGKSSFETGTGNVPEIADSTQQNTLLGQIDIPCSIGAVSFHPLHRHTRVIQSEPCACRLLGERLHLLPSCRLSSDIVRPLCATAGNTPKAAGQLPKTIRMATCLMHMAAVLENSLELVGMGSFPDVVLETTTGR